RYGAVFMKNFFTSMLGALAALVIFAGGCLVLFLGFLMIIAALGGDKGTPEIERGSYLVFDLSANITDAPPPIDFSMLRGGRDGTLQLRTVTRALHAAAKGSRIAGLVITGRPLLAGYGTAYAALKEVRAALLDFKAAGKPVTAYLTYASTKDYYLASAATELALDPYGLIEMPGLASEPMFFAGAFEKYGIGVQVTRVGKYKSAVEPFTRKDMSPENRTELQKLLDDIWAGVLTDVALSRGLTPAQIQAVVDREGLIRPEAAKSAKLIDRIAYRDEIFDTLKAKTGRAGTKEPFKQVLLSDYAKQAKDIADTPRKADGEAAKPTGRSRIAIVYAEGEIVRSEEHTSE